jgi:hypothetical protein
MLLSALDNRLNRGDFPSPANRDIVGPVQWLAFRVFVDFEDSLVFEPLFRGFDALGPPVLGAASMWLNILAWPSRNSNSAIGQ